MIINRRTLLEMKNELQVWLNKTSALLSAYHLDVHPHPRRQFLLGQCEAYGQVIQMIIMILKAAEHRADDEHCDCTYCEARRDDERIISPD